jgi:hypothetical protein
MPMSCAMAKCMYTAQTLVLHFDACDPYLYTVVTNWHQSHNACGDRTANCAAPRCSAASAAVVAAVVRSVDDYSARFLASPSRWRPTLYRLLLQNV